MDVASFDEIAKEFNSRVARIVWCSVATVDAKGRPRSRILHPIWEGSTGWIATGRHSHKEKHLEKNPYVSLSYWDQQHQQIYIDAKAEWIDDAGREEAALGAVQEHAAAARLRPADDLAGRPRRPDVRPPQAHAVAHRAVRAERHVRRQGSAGVEAVASRRP